MKEEKQEYIPPKIEGLFPLSKSIAQCMLGEIGDALCDEGEAPDGGPCGGGSVPPTQPTCSPGDIAEACGDGYTVTE